MARTAQTKKKAPAVKTTAKTAKTEKKFDFLVEKGIPITGARTIFAQDNFPFEKMNVGDSFLIPKDHPFAKNPNVLHYACKQYNRLKPGFVITTRMQIDKNRRVWRLK